MRGDSSIQYRNGDAAASYAETTCQDSAAYCLDRVVLARTDGTVRRDVQYPGISKQRRKLALCDGTEIVAGSVETGCLKSTWPIC